MPSEIYDFLSSCVAPFLVYLREVWTNHATVKGVYWQTHAYLNICIISMDGWECEEIHLITFNQFAFHAHCITSTFPWMQSTNAHALSLYVADVGKTHWTQQYWGIVV